MRLWSPRFETKASVRPSGDHAGDSLAPRAKNAASAGFDPSSGAIQIRRLFTKATRVLSGATCGSSPSPRSFGEPPATGTDHTCILGWIGLLAGLGGSPARLDPWSP